LNIRRIIATAATAVLVGSGVALATALPASAHTFGVTATCEDGLTVNLTNYHPTIPGKDAVPGTPAIPGAHHDAVGEPTITVDNPDYVPGQDAVATTYVQEWRFVHKVGDNSHAQDKWMPFDWNPGKGWDRTGDHRDTTTILVQGHDAIPAQGTPTIEVPNPDYVAAHDDPETPAVPGTDAVPEQHNHVTIIRDGEQLVSSDFGPAFQENYPTPDKTVGHTYTVTVASLDGIGEFTKTLSTDACVVVTPPTPGAANPAATISSSCGLAEVNLTNDGEDILTASFVVYVDGNFHGAYAVQDGDHQKVSLAFDEDSGDHLVVVRSGPAQGDKALATATVKSDCKPAVVTPPTEQPTTPATPAQPAAPAQPVAPAAAPQALVETQPTEDVLAHTGSSEAVRNVVLGSGALVLALIGTAGILWSRRPGIRRQG